VHRGKLGEERIKPISSVEAHRNPRGYAHLCQPLTSPSISTGSGWAPASLESIIASYNPL
jgi:hypothetical protein